ncbi:MAG: UvrD-helicase domain-containing protein [Clostridia bacterium]|nr:UvrD-helicase domain-containing protein [Clostridia bacterium]
MEYLQGLNEKQLEAVEHTEGYLRVIAGAGSGKTKLIVSRYAYLVKEYGIDAANILCVTFTNKASGEMKRRIRGIIGGEYDTSLICTYHGFCVRVLREDVEKIFYPKEFQIIDTTSQKAILGDVYQKFELKLDHGSFEKMAGQIGAYKYRDRGYVERMCSSDKCQIMDRVSTQDDQIIEEYLQRQKQVFAMDFDDLMFFTLDVLRRCPDVLEKWQDRLNYIQVDEFQDSSGTEMELIDLLSAKHKNLMIVGDPDQNIYEWRGSDVRLLVDFDKTHTPCETVFLNRNYRSTPEILKCANTLIEKNVYRLKKDLYTKSGPGADVFHYHMKHEFAEAEKIVDIILDLRRREGCSYSDFAVMYRSGFLSRIVEKKFTECGIPYEIFGGVKFYHRMEVQDVVAYLRLIAFDDDISFKRIVNKPRRRFGRVKLQALQAMQMGESLFETLKANVESGAFKNSGAADFVDMIDELRREAFTHPVSETVERVCALSGYEKYIRELGDMERFENLSKFKRIATEYEANLGESITLKEFLNHIALQSEDDGEESAEKVKLMTIHASKGLEFPTVFVIGFSEGIFPSSKTIEERREMGLEEERRLCYVAITRAERRLYLFDSEGHIQSGSKKLPSRFLWEIGEENYIRVGTISKELQAEANRYVKSNGVTSEPESAESESAAVGDKVTHHVFGDGIITEVLNNKYRIRFEKLKSDRVLSCDYFKKEHYLPSVSPPLEEEKEERVAENEVERDPHPVLVKLEDADETLPKRMLYEGIIKKKELVTVKEVMPRRINNEGSSQKSDWRCTGVSDLGAPMGLCQICKRQNIRYVHHMTHPTEESIDVGCICAGRLEGDVEGAKHREASFKNRESRRESFMSREWKRSKNNNIYLKIKDTLIVLYQSEKSRKWKYSLDNVFCADSFSSKEEAMSAAFDALERKLSKA